MAVESCGRIQNVGESYRIHWGFIEGYGSLWNIGVHRIGNYIECPGMLGNTKSWRYIKGGFSVLVL